MNHESDHVHMMALADALGIPLAVEYMDRSSPHLLQHTFGPPPASQHSHSSTPESASACASASSSACASASACAPATAHVANGFIPEPTCVPKPADASKDASQDASQNTSLDLRALHVTLLYRPGHLDILYGK